MTRAALMFGGLIEPSGAATEPEYVLCDHGYLRRGWCDDCQADTMDWRDHADPWLIMLRSRGHSRTASSRAASRASPAAAGDAAESTREAPFSQPLAPMPAATPAPPDAAQELSPAAPAAPVYPYLTVHAGAVSAVGVVTEWWRPLGGDVESRDLRFLGPDGLWLDGDGLPQSLRDAGCSITNVAGTTRHVGINHPTLNVGWAVSLLPEPTDSSGGRVVGVWTTDRVLQVGYLPRDVAAATMAEAPHEQSEYGALVAAESRRVGSNDRVGLKVLLGPGDIRAETSS